MLSKWRALVLLSTLAVACTVLMLTRKRTWNKRTSNSYDDEVTTRAEPVSFVHEGEDLCAAAVENATERRQRGLNDCTCGSDYSLLGDDEACGDGTQRRFKSEELEGKGCKCMANKECPPLETAPDFNLNEFISARWYVQQQMETQYVTKEDNYCVTARYEEKDEPSPVWGYTVSVFNAARTGGVDGEEKGGELCAHMPEEEDPARLAVAPCFVPKAFSGPYWVLTYNEALGYALVSGGQPEIATPLGCRTSDGTNDAGLWIFTRAAIPEPGLVQAVRDIAGSKGFDLSVLNDVTHEGCSGPGYDNEPDLIA